MPQACAFIRISFGPSVEGIGDSRMALGTPALSCQKTRLIFVDMMRDRLLDLGKTKVSQFVVRKIEYDLGSG